MREETDSVSAAQATALYVSAFFDELARWGVREAVISPGSRSTALSMTAFEMSRRFPDRMRVYVDVDERGASFLALGLAKASGRPVCLVCTSGTALANYYPAVMEAETSRVPLIVLSGDRPLRLQNFGAPQTVDQMKAYSTHVRAFRQMTMPSADAREISFARQAAREACLAALGPGAVPPGAGGEGMIQVASRGGRYFAGPVQINFQLDEPLTPDLSVEGLFVCGRGPLWSDEFDSTNQNVSCASEFAAGSGGSLRGDELVDVNDGLQTVGESVGAGRTLLPVMAIRQQIDAAATKQLVDLMCGRRTLVLAGEGSCETVAEARELIAWAERFDLPLLADPLSGLRGFSDRVVIDNYDNVFGRDDCPLPQVVVRFGRWPISKRCTKRLAAARPVNVVVDVAETRDFTLATDVFVPCTPLAFVRSFACDEPFAASSATAHGSLASHTDSSASALRDPLASHTDFSACVAAPFSRTPLGPEQTAFARAWVECNDAERVRIRAVESVERDVEGAFVRKLLELAPEGSCLFSSNSMPIRALDTFYVKDDKRLAVLCNRGQNGIDGTVSTALGVSQHFRQTTFMTGDFTMLHDLNALALQREIRMHHGGDAAPSIVIVLLNNNGGAIFDMLPQKSTDAYFDRLFTVPQDVRFADAARAFDVPYRWVDTVTAFAEAYGELLGTPGISLVEVKLPLAGVTERYGVYQ